MFIKQNFWPEQCLHFLTVEDKRGSLYWFSCRTTSDDLGIKSFNPAALLTVLTRTNYFTVLVYLKRPFLHNIILKPRRHVISDLEPQSKKAWHVTAAAEGPTWRFHLCDVRNNEITRQQWAFSSWTPRCLCCLSTFSIVVRTRPCVTVLLRRLTRWSRRSIRRCCYRTDRVNVKLASQSFQVSL